MGKPLGGNLKGAREEQPPLNSFPFVPRFSVRVNTTDLFHVDLRYWSTLRAKDSHRGPRERAFHSATVIGNYMVVYGECRTVPVLPSPLASDVRIHSGEFFVFPCALEFNLD